MYNCIFDKKVENVKNCVIGVVEQVKSRRGELVLGPTKESEVIESAWFGMFLPSRKKEAGALSG